MGVDVEHNFNENFILGATILNVTERPLTPKVNFGGEPINNTMLGMNIDFSTEMPLFTKLANKLPFVDTDCPLKFISKSRYGLSDTGLSKRNRCCWLCNFLYRRF